MRHFLILLALVSLTACAEVQTNIQADLAKVQAITVPDLQAAFEDAKAHNDMAAANCYFTLLAVVQSKVQMPTIKGVASAFQASRDVVSGNVVNDLAKNVNIGCAALFVDVNFTLAKIAGTMGVGAIPALPVP